MRENIITAPFEQAGKLISVEALLNGSPRTFIFDSGAFISILNSACKTEKSAGRVKTGDGAAGNCTPQVQIKDVNTETGSCQAAVTTVNTLQFAGRQVKNAELLSLDLSHLEKSLKLTNLAGLIGFNLIEGSDFALDYRKKELTFIKPEHLQESSLIKNAESIDMELEDHIPVLKVLIGGREYNFGIDTGAEKNLIDESIVKEIKKELQVKETEKVELMGAAGQSLGVSECRIKSLTVNTKTYTDMEAVISGISHLNAKRKTHLSGLLGFPFLSAQKTVISYSLKKIFLHNTP